MRPSIMERDICLHVWISGRVQGVCYRDWTCQEAQQRGVRGWVRNLTDGRVEALFQGTPSAVRALVEACREGPRLAVVNNIHSVEESPYKECTHFSIHYRE